MFTNPSLRSSRIHAALAALAAMSMSAGAGGIPAFGDFGTAPYQLPRRHRSTNKFTPHQGDRECERRRRQMETGEFQVGGPTTAVGKDAKAWNDAWARATGAA